MVADEVAEAWWDEAGQALARLVDQLEPALSVELVGELRSCSEGEREGEAALTLARHLRAVDKVRLPARDVLLLRTLVRTCWDEQDDPWSHGEWARLASNPEAMSGRPMGVRYAVMAPSRQGAPGLLLACRKGARPEFHDLTELDLDQTLADDVGGWLMTARPNRGVWPRSYRRRGFEVGARLMAKLGCERVVVDPEYGWWAEATGLPGRERRRHAAAGVGTL